MKIQYILSLLLLLGLQACSSVEGPVHFYAGQPRPPAETAQLKVPAALTVVKIDGREVKVPSQTEGYYAIYLLPGVHRVDFKYELSWGDNDSGMLVKSDVVGVESQFFAGKKYELVYPVPTEEEEAFWMARRFKAQLVEMDTGRQIATRPTTELNAIRSKAAMADPGSATIQANVKPVTTTGSTGDMVPTDFNADIGLPKDTDKHKPEATVDSTGVAVPANINEESAVREDSVKRLKFWWLMANEEERSRFKKWLKFLEGGEAK